MVRSLIGRGLAALGLAATAVSCGPLEAEPAPRPCAGPRESEASMNLETLYSSLAGTWYPARTETLRRELDQFIAAASNPPMADVCAILLPHAGYRYSGPVAAHGVKAVQGRHYDRVIILGPSHRLFLPDTIAVPVGTGALATPLGEVCVDHALINRLAAEGGVFKPLHRAFTGEHSVEIEVPFLQVALEGGFTLVPLVVGQLSETAAAEAGRRLAREMNATTLLVVSSDFTHHGKSFGYVPFERDIPERIRDLDLNAFELIRRRDPAGFADYLRRTGATICGHDPIQVMLNILPAGAQVHFLQYDQSGRITGDWENSVSYLAAAVTRGPAAKETP